MVYGIFLMIINLNTPARLLPIHMEQMKNKRFSRLQHSRTPDGKIHDGMGGIGLILSKTKVPVQPLRISGAYEFAMICPLLSWSAVLMCRPGLGNQRRPR